MTKNIFNRPQMIKLNTYEDDRGALTYVESNQLIPFDIKRVYYLYDLPRSSIRGGHAHKELSQLIIAISGSFDVILDDGQIKQCFSLNRPDFGLYIPCMFWRELNNFSTNAISLVLASDLYYENDYYRDYEHFLMDKQELKE